MRQPVIAVALLATLGLGLGACGEKAPTNMDRNPNQGATTPAPMPPSTSDQGSSTGAAGQSNSDTTSQGTTDQSGTGTSGTSGAGTSGAGTTGAAPSSDTGTSSSKSNESPSSNTR